MFNSVPICRSVEGHWVFDDAEYFKLWYVMLSRAQYKSDQSRGVFNGVMYTQERGEFMFGRREWSRRYNISEQRIRKFIALLEADNMIVRTKITRQFSIYRIVNFDKFNPTKNIEIAGTNDDGQPKENPSRTHPKPMKTPQTTTIKNVKTDKTHLVEENYLRLAELLRDRITAWKPNAKVPDSPRKLQEWAASIRLSMERDGRSEEELETVICWATGDSFWQVNILSADALRRNFDKLQAKMMQSKPIQSPGRDYSKIRM